MYIRSSTKSTKTETTIVFRIHKGQQSTTNLKSGGRCRDNNLDDDYDEGEDKREKRFYKNGSWSQYNIIN